MGPFQKFPSIPISSIVLVNVYWPKPGFSSGTAILYKIYFWKSERVLFNTNSAIFQLYHDGNNLIFNEDDDEVCFVLDQHAELDFYSANSLKQQYTVRHVAPLGHIILIPSQPVFALSPEWCVLSGEVTHTNFIVFGWFEHTINRTRGVFSKELYDQGQV